MTFTPAWEKVVPFGHNRGVKVRAHQDYTDLAVLVIRGFMGTDGSRDAGWDSKWVVTKDHVLQLAEMLLDAADKMVEEDET